MDLECFGLGEVNMGRLAEQQHIHTAAFGGSKLSNTALTQVPFSYLPVTKFHLQFPSVVKRIKYVQPCC